MASAEAVVSRIDIPGHEQHEIVELYRKAVLKGTAAHRVSPRGEVKPLPEAVYTLLVQILKDLSEGCSVAILQERRGLTTVQASKMLGVSRQFFVNLIDKGEIPHPMVGTHRRVLLKDLMGYKEKRDKSRNAVLRTMFQSEREAGVYEVIPSDDFTGQ